MSRMRAWALYEQSHVLGLGFRKCDGRSRQKPRVFPGVFYMPNAVAMQINYDFKSPWRPYPPCLRRRENSRQMIVDEKMNLSR